MARGTRGRTNISGVRGREVLDGPRSRDVLEGGRSRQVLLGPRGRTTGGGDVVVNPTGTEPPDWSFYTVQAGDTLYSLVQRANQRPNAEDITIAQVVEWNDIENPDLIFVGQVLRYV